MSKPNLAITIRSLNKKASEYNKLSDFFEISYINKSGKRLCEQEVIHAIKNADAVLAGTEPFNRKVLKSSNKLKIISRVGIGIDNIDLITANEQKIVIYNTPDAPTKAVAEHTLALIMALYKNLIRYNKTFTENSRNIITGKLISGKNAGIIGLGRIGYSVAKLLSAIGCNIGYYDPFISREDIPKGWKKFNSINELLASSDIITLHISPRSDNKSVISLEEFKHFKHDSILINTARSSLIDERALLNALDHGIISGAGLDVYDNIIEDQIQNYPQIILTPHVASNTKESRYEMEAEAINNLIKAIMEN